MGELSRIIWGKCDHWGQTFSKTSDRNNLPGINAQAANLTLEDIPTAYELSETEAADHQKFTTLLGIKETLMESSVPIGCLSQAQTDNLMDYVEANRPLITAAAVAMLKQNDPDFVFNEIILEPDTNSVPKQALASLKSKKESLLKLYPNPAMDYITVKYWVNEFEYRRLSIQIIDVKGRLLFVQEIPLGSLEHLIDLRKYAKGSYLLQLVADGSIIGVEKFSKVY